MNIELDKKALISMIRGTEPHYGIMDHLHKLGLGSYTGGMADQWKWANEWNFPDYSEKELYNIYLSVRDRL